ncbi:MAG: alkaline phosphatase D family protein [Pirellulales bacterium]
MPAPLYRVARNGSIGRRDFLVMTGSLWAAALWSTRSLGAVLAAPKFSDNPFQLGVASGDPQSDGVVLWTRLAPKPLEGGGMPDEAVQVDWQVAEDEQMTKVVQQGATVANPDWAHSVHVEVAGLKPDRWYFYQFRAGNETSPTGRTRTAPAADTLPDRLRFAVASCQHFETGYYTAYEHMLRESPDLVVHLGDYIYEGAGRDKQVRRHVGPKLMTVEDYRLRHAQYKTDPALRAMHAAAPWLVTWDDHEFENNCANLIPEHPKPLEVYRQQRANAYKAYYEHMPLRVSQLPQGPDMPLYRRVSFGRLADFHVLDTRQYRTDQPCGDGGKAPCEASYDAAGTILGDAQRAWLFDGLSASPAQWNVLAQQVMMARVDFREGDEVAHSMDQWPGYEADRRRVLTHLHEHKVKNPVVLTGDIHSNWANELPVDFDNLDGSSVAVEFVGTSISSSGDGSQESERQSSLLSENPFVKFHNRERGYVLCEVTPDNWRSDYRTVEYVSRKGAPLNTRASFVVEAGKSKLERA